MKQQTRRCKSCNRRKKRHLFYAREWNKKSAPVCKSCWKKSDGFNKDRDRYYRDTYNISLDEYNNLLKEQGGTCFICRKKPGKRRLAVDHDHKLERLGMRQSVRGLLCGKCNDFLGHIRDDSTHAKNMMVYLERGAAVRRGALQ